MECKFKAFNLISYINTVALHTEYCQTNCIVSHLANNLEF
jgi:hypothetical protein